MERRTSLSRSLFYTPTRSAANPVKTVKDLEPPPVTDWLALISSSDWPQLDSSLRSYWSDCCPIIFAPHPDKPWDLGTDDGVVNNLLLAPLVALLCGDRDATGLETLGSKLTNRNKLTQICGHVFKSGEPNYTCRECAADPTCVMCYECFSNSAHVNHRYQMHTSGGSGYCDCGDTEAWTSAPVCNLHKATTPDDQNMEWTSEESKLPQEVVDRLEGVTHLVLSYAIELVCSKEEILPQSLTCKHMEQSHQTILFNDETHTYDGVIRALELAIHCTEEQAMLLATIVDRERKTAKDTSIRTEKRGPLVVSVLESCLVAHQQLAIRLLVWLNKMAQQFPPLGPIIGKILMEKKFEDDTLVDKMMKMDMQLWKAARNNFHQLLMGTVLMDMECKQQFARMFTRLYGKLMKDFIDDDHEHSVSILSLTVQMYTVPTIARLLVIEENALSTVLGALCEHCAQNIGPKGKYDFSKKSFPAVLRRALVMTCDAKYLLCTVPTAKDWSQGLREAFLLGCDVLLEFVSRLQGMDEVKRQTGEHQVWESEWETAFNMQLRIQNILALVQAWAVTDATVLRSLIEKCLLKLRTEITRTEANKTEDVEVCGHSTRCVSFDVSTGPMSIHVPINRLLSTLLLCNNNMCICDSLELDRMDAVNALMESSLRVIVMNAQAQAAMWRRNGYALLNQIHNYYSPLCRSEMFDKDILMIQVCGSQMCANDLVVRLLHKFGLHRWAQSDYEEQRSAEELSKQVITLAEEFMHLCIILLAERHNPLVGQCQQIDWLRREIVHILCRGPTPYSKIAKCIPDHPSVEKLAVEDVVKQVGVFRKPTGTSAGMFELKKECFTEYSPFFYHYSKSDFSQAEQQQQKDRKNSSKEISACAPLLGPAFTTPFTSLTSLLNCPIMLQILTNSLERTVRHSRVSSDGLLHRAVYLICMALNEQLSQQNGFNFTTAARVFAEQQEKPTTLLDLMEKLAGKSEASTINELLTYTIARYKEAENKGSDTELAQEPTEKDATAEADEKAKRQKIAQQKRQKAMEQMARLQKAFIKQHKGLLEDDLTKEENEHEEDEFSKLLDESQFPVCVGITQSAIQPVPVRKTTCILCQENEQITFSSKPLVYAAFIQKSKLFSKHGAEDQIPNLLSDDTIFVSSDLVTGTHISTCAHTMHWDCYQEFFSNLLDREHARTRQQIFFSQRTLDVDGGEFSCPLCKRLSNAALPLLPTLTNMNTMPAYRRVDTVTDFSEWLVHVRGRLETEHGHSNAVRKRSHSAASDGQQAESSEGAMSSSLPNPLPPLFMGSDDEMEEMDPELAAAEEPGAPATHFDLSTEARNLLRHILPQSLATRVHRFLHANSQDDFVPGFFKNWDMVRIFAQSLCTHTARCQPERLPGETLATLALTSAAYTLHCVCAVLKHERKPLFGALSTRTKDCMYVLNRFAMNTQFFCNPDKLRANARTLLSCLLGSHKQHPALLDVFSTLVHLCASIGWLELDAADEWTLPNGGAQESFVLRLTLSAYLYQSLLSWSPDAQADQSESSTLLELWRKQRDWLAVWHPMSEEKQPDLTNHLKAAVIDFLRPCALFFHTITHVPPPEALKDPSIDEFEPLCRYLGLPTKLELLVHFAVIEDLWIKWSQNPELRECVRNSKLRKQPIEPNLLIKLPHDFGSLINKAVKFTCPNLNRDESRAPTLCLVCGSMLCSQSYCCQRAGGDGKEQVGACNQHMQSCSGTSGLFVRVRDSQVVLLTSKHRGSFRPAPYVDEFGETDQGFRRGNPLHLNSQLYDRLQQLWLHHSVPEQVVNQYEIDHRNVAVDWQHFGWWPSKGPKSMKSLAELDDYVLSLIIENLPLKARLKCCTLFKRWFGLCERTRYAWDVLELHFGSVAPDITLTHGPDQWQFEFPTWGRNQGQFLKADQAELLPQCREMLLAVLQQVGPSVSRLELGGRERLDDQVGLLPDYEAIVPMEVLEMVQSFCPSLHSLHLKHVLLRSEASDLLSNSHPLGSGLRCLCMHSVHFETHPQGFLADPPAKMHTLALADTNADILRHIGHTLRERDRRLGRLYLWIEKHWMDSVSDHPLSNLSDLLNSSDSVICSLHLAMYNHSLCLTAFPSLCEHTSLSSLQLNMSGHSLHSQSQTRLFSHLIYLTQLNTLKVIGPDKLFNSESWLVLCQCLNQNTALRTLELNTVTDRLKAADWDAFVTLMPALEHLWLRKCMHFENRHLYNIVNKCPDLVTLDLGLCPKLGNNILGYVFRNAKKLEAVSISGNERMFPGHVWLAADALVTPNLKFVRLGNNSKFGFKHELEVALRARFGRVEREGSTLRIYRMSRGQWLHRHFVSAKWGKCVLCDQFASNDD